MSKGIAQPDIFRKLFDSLPDGLIVTDSEGHILEANLAFAEWLERDLSELRGRKFIEFVHPEDWAKTLYAAANLHEKIRLYQFTNRYVTKSGKIISISWNASLTEQQGLFGVGRNVTGSRIGTNYSNEIFFEISENRKIINYNMAFISAFGVDPSTTDELSQLIPGGDSLLRAMEDLNRSDNDTLELRYFHEASRRWYEVVVYKHPPFGSGFVLKDITSYLEALETAKHREEQYRLITDVTNDAIWNWDLGTNRVTWSSGFKKLFGYGDEDLEGDVHSWADRIHPDEKKKVLERIHAAIDHSDVWQDEYRFLKKDGSYAFVLDRGSIVRDADGKPLRMLGGMTDRTKENVALERLREFKSIVENSSDGIITTTESFQITYANHEAKELFGFSWTPERNALISDLLPSEEWQKLNSSLTIPRSFNSPALEVFLPSRGAQLRLECRITVLKSHGGRPSQFVFRFNDVTEKNLLQQQAYRDQRLQSLGILAGGVAHDLNNILAPILLCSETIAEESEDPRLKNMANLITKNIERATETIGRILVFSRGQIQKNAIFNAQGTLKDIYRIIVETFPKSLEISLFENCKEPISLFGNASLLEQTLLNLCINARDALPDEGGQIDLCLDLVDDVKLSKHRSLLDPTKSYCCLSVRDNGCGMSDEVKTKVFEPFFSTKGVGKGTGLGLPSCHAIVKNHKGILTFESAPGQGSTFYIYLPIHQDKVDLPPPAKAEPLRCGQGQKILVVEDEPHLRKLLASFLQGKGYQVLSATDGLEALGILKSQQEIDLVLTDIMMPHMGGKALIQEIEAMNRPLAVVAMSGNTQDPLPKHVRTISKPFKMHQLLDEICRTLQMQSIAS